jgi:hypothetical protein
MFNAKCKIKALYFGDGFFFRIPFAVAIDWPMILAN